MTQLSIPACRFPIRPLAAALMIALAVDSAAITPATGAAAAGLAIEASMPGATTGNVVVQNCNDSGSGSLRDAYANAADGVTIDLTQLTCSRITLATGALADPGGAMEAGAAGVTLKGSGQTIDANGASRVLVHNGADTLTIHDLSLVNGSYDSKGHGGGCIYTYGDLTLESSVVSSCKLISSSNGDVLGGAVYSRHRVMIYKGSAVLNSSATATKYGSAQGGGVWGRGVFVDHSTVALNAAVGDKAGSRGGGIFATYNAVNKQAFGMAYSTVSSNSANRAGGIYVYGDARIIRSTISANQAGGDGGGVFVLANPSYAFTHTLFALDTISGNQAGSAGGGAFIDAAAAIIDCTIANNSGEYGGGGLYLVQSPSLLAGTIVAGNSSTRNAAGADVAGRNTDLTSNYYNSYNLIRASTLTLPDGTLTDDPELGPLQDNGGPTFTQALLAGSPAIDAGTYYHDFDYDQRGRSFRRVVGTYADIGAFELQDTVFSSGFETNR